MKLPKSLLLFIIPMKNKNFADVGGMASASLCIVHCLLTPFLLITFAGISWLEEMEFLFVGFSLLAALFATITNKRSIYLIGIWVGALILLLSLLLEEHFSFAIYFVYGASLLLIVSHYLNRKFQKL
jgi:hypothetical protein